MAAFRFYTQYTMEQLEEIIEQLQLENNKKTAADPLTKVSLGIVEDFLKSNHVMCYGGTAINNLLPPEDQFYDYESEVPDYDFFSKTPQEHSMKLANQLTKAGIKNVQVRPGMHLGTFKVFADFSGVADITQLDTDVFDRLWDEKIVRDGIHYVSPNFLRMSMFLELSRPRGDVSRWKKVYERLQLLNKHYPIVCPAIEENHTPLDEKHRKKVETMLRSRGAVLLGVTASQIHARGKYGWYTPVSMLANKRNMEALTAGEKTKSHEGSEILPAYTDILDDKGDVIIRIHETNACHSYHQMKNGIRVASIPTILQIFFAFMYSGGHKNEIAQLMCVAQRLMDLVNKQKSRRFKLLTPIDCIGQQEMLVDMRKHKAVLYEKLSKNQSSADFLRYFFTYNPTSMTTTQRAKLRDQLRKTRKARLT